MLSPEVKAEYKRDILFTLIVIIFGIHIMFKSTQMRNFGEDVTSPGLFPFVIGVLIVVLAASILYTTIKVLLGNELDRDLGKYLFTMEEIREWAKSPGNIRVVALIALFYVYIRLILALDFVVVSIVFLFAAFMLLRNVALWKAALISLATPFIIQYVFTTLFRVGMP